MNVLIISAVFPPEPVVSSNISYDIASELANKGNNVTVLCPKPSRPLGYKFSKDIRTDILFQRIVLPSFTSPRSRLFPRFYESYSFGNHCKKYIENNSKNIDIIYINTWPLFSQVLILKSSIKFKLPVITHVQDIYPESLINKLPLFKNLAKKILLPLDKYVLRNSRFIITISNKMKDYLIESRGIETKKISVVYNWQDDSCFQPKQTEKENKVNEPFTFMFLGSLSPSANIEHLIKGYIEAKIENSRFIIAGSGSQKEALMKLANSNKNIQFVEALVDKVAELQDKADVLVLSLKKGQALYALPSKIPAYMYSAKPIIGCVDSGGDSAFTINESGCGWVLEPDDTSVLVKYFKKVSRTDRNILVDMGMNGFNYANVYFSQKNNLKEITDRIYEAGNL